MPLYTIEMTNQQEEDILINYICKLKDKYGTSMHSLVHEMVDKYLMEHHQYTAFWLYLQTKIDVDTTIKYRKDFYELTLDETKKYRRCLVKTIVEEYYLEWYEKVWKSRLETRLKNSDLLKYFKKEGSLVMENNTILNIKKVKSSK
tara:strand:- start:1005 stop:1442 length:438 start_codon:yes stop_codon:yes gene_type:complete